MQYGEVAAHPLNNAVLHLAVCCKLSFGVHPPHLFYAFAHHRDTVMFVLHLVLAAAISTAVGMHCLCDAAGSVLLSKALRMLACLKPSSQPDWLQRQGVGPMCALAAIGAARR